MTAAAVEAKDEPKILVFSTNNISDPGVDLAGSSHLHYPPTVAVISLPCTSGIRPAWIVRALAAGFDGVFLAADGEECQYLSDCTGRSARIVEAARTALAEAGADPGRVRMSAVCSVCAEPFVNQVRDFAGALRKMGPAGKGL